MTLGGLVTGSKSDITALKEELAKAPSIALYYDAKTAPNNYVDQVPDISSYG